MMEDLLRVLFLLCAIAAPGHSLSCLTCAAKDSTCKGTSMTCPTGSSCGLAYRETTKDGITTKYYIKSCVPSNKCTKVGRISYSGGQMKMGISCCKTDNCTPRPPKLPADSTKVNGLTCPTCRSTASNSCDSQPDIECTGNEQICINQNTVTSVSEDNAMGCATQSICDMKDFFYNDGWYQIAMKFMCDSGSNSAGTLDAESTPLSCVVCTSNETLDCKGELEKCPLNHRCASAYKVITTSEKLLYRVHRSCVLKDKCDFSGSLSLNRENVIMGISCCNEDGCTPLVAPPKNSVRARPNGVTCNTCISNSDSDSDADACEPTGTMNCSGDETQCLLYALIASLSNSGSPPFRYSVRGCGSLTLCNILSFSYKVTNVKYVNRLTCIEN